MNESGEYFLFYISEHRSRRSVAPKLRMSNSDVRYAVEEFPPSRYTFTSAPARPQSEFF